MELLIYAKTGWNLRSVRGSKDKKNERIMGKEGKKIR